MLELGRVAGDDGREPERTGLGATLELDRSLDLRFDGVELARYVYRPWEPRVEAPHPYLHPIRTLGGELVSLYRPHDHVWHKGLSFAVANIDEDNFWGGPTYHRTNGYEHLDNHGTVRHRDWERLEVSSTRIAALESLAWHDHADLLLLNERRELAFDAAPEHGAWRMTFTTELLNAVERPIVFGSPTTRGRENAGYGGLTWRGPRSFTDGFVVSPDGVGGDDLMGSRADWMAFVGKHDGQGTASTVLFVDSPLNPRHPTTWFARSERYALLGPAPFFRDEYRLEPGASLRLSYDVIVADGASDVSRCADLAALFRERSR